MTRPISPESALDPIAIDAYDQRTEAFFGQKEAEAHLQKLETLLESNR